jgi:transposase
MLFFERLMRWTLLSAIGVIMRQTEGVNHRYHKGASIMTKFNTIAIDLAKNVFQVCILTPDRKVIKNRQVSRSQLPEIIVNQPKSIVAMEACYSSHYWARTFAAMGHEVRLIPAQHVKPFVRGNKNDKNDALAIAEASLRPNIKFVPLKSTEQQDIQSLHRIRDRLVMRKTGLINQTRGLLSEYGIIIPLGVPAFRKHLPALASDNEQRLSQRVKRQLLETINELFCMTDRCDQINRELVQIARLNPLCKRLMSIPGIGVINATALYAAIGNASQFSHPRELPVWLGLTPRQFASGNKSFNSGITKRGNKYLRKQLVHGARSLLYSSTKKTDKLSVWINQIAERRGKNKAAVALASRLARLAWFVLNRNEDYRVVT